VQHTYPTNSIDVDPAAAAAVTSGVGGCGGGTVLATTAVTARFIVRHVWRHVLPSVVTSWSCLVAKQQLNML